MYWKGCIKKIAADAIQLIFILIPDNTIVLTWTLDSIEGG